MEAPSTSSQPELKGAMLPQTQEIFMLMEQTRSRFGFTEIMRLGPRSIVVGWAVVDKEIPVFPYKNLSVKINQDYLRQMDTVLLSYKYTLVFEDMAPGSFYQSRSGLGGVNRSGLMELSIGESDIVISDANRLDEYIEAYLDNFGDNCQRALITVGPRSGRRLVCALSHAGRSHRLIKSAAELVGKELTRLDRERDIGAPDLRSLAKSSLYCSIVREVVNAAKP